MNSCYLLKGGTIVTPEHVYCADVRTSFGRVEEVGADLKARRNERVLDCVNHFIYPGLVNAHDHLPFNLFPQLGNPPYANSYEWGNDIHARFKQTIGRITRIPLYERLLWGAWKNLFSGITSVVHHDPYYLPFHIKYPLRVLKRYTFAHSLGFEPDIRHVLKRRRKNCPFIIHLAEGIDERAASEVSHLREIGGLDDRTVAVHAVGVQGKDIEILQDSKASVVWCPVSNKFLFNRTAPVDVLAGKVPIAIGTDSTLTGSVTLFDELRAARQVHPFTPKEVFAMVTESPRRMFRMPADVGTVVEGGRADLFLLPSKSVGPYTTLLGAQPGDITALFTQGRIQFYDSDLDSRFSSDSSYFGVQVNGRTKRIVSTSLARYYQQLKPFLSHYTYLN